MKQADPALRVIRPPDAPPASFSSSVFLGGPLEPASSAPGGWRDQAIDLLARAGYEGTVFVAQCAPGQTGTRRNPAWENAALELSDAVLLWIPHGMRYLDPISAEQLGAWKRSGKILAGAADPTALRELRRSAGCLSIPISGSLEDLVRGALPLLRPGASREGAERLVPLFIWRSPAFQRWYRALRGAGNRLDDIAIEWCYRVRARPGRAPLLWAVRPRIFIKAEERHKSTEVVVGRADISATVLYSRGASLLDTRVVLVREFRSAGTGATGYVWELPGGSAEHAADRDHDPRATAAREILQETGLLVPAERLDRVPAGSRQVAATILSHSAHLFRMELRPEELRILLQVEEQGIPHGANPGERCFVAIRTLGEILRSGDVDWGQVGMIMLALAGCVAEDGSG